MEILNITQGNFEGEVVNSDVPVLLDFWAPWCGPCRKLTPIIEEIAAEADGFKVGKVNVDNEVALAKKFGVQSIPTLVVLEKGEVKAKTVGMAPKTRILELLK